jgi:hypothetical protein
MHAPNIAPTFGDNNSGIENNSGNKLDNRSYSANNNYGRNNLFYANYRSKPTIVPFVWNLSEILTKPF